MAKYVKASKLHVLIVKIMQLMKHVFDLPIYDARRRRSLLYKL